jgi:hypothetical protein
MGIVFTSWGLGFRATLIKLEKRGILENAKADDL